MYLLAWDLDRDDWRVFRADRVTPRIPTGPRFVPREIADPVAFLAARFKGSAGADRWPCEGSAVLAAPAADVVPFAGDGTVEPLGDDRCRVRLGAWSWPGLAALLARFDTDITDASPDALRAAFAGLASRAAAAAGAKIGG